MQKNYSYYVLNATSYIFSKKSFFSCCFFEAKLEWIVVCIRNFLYTVPYFEKWCIISFQMDKSLFYMYIYVNKKMLM